MAIPTSRTDDIANISVDHILCNGCGLCVKVCKDFSLELKDNRAVKSKTPLFGCFACGQCMMVCPTDAIKIEGRFIDKDQLIDLNNHRERASYESLTNLYLGRRSVREFQGRSVHEDTLKKILDITATAPIGLPPTDVQVLVLNSRAKTREFALDFCKLLEKVKWMFSRPMLTLMKPFWGNSMDQLSRSFINPAIEMFINEMKEERNLVTYDAPLALYFYGTQFSDPADPIVAATAAMYAAESLGLSTCMIGSVHPFLQYGRAAKEFRRKYGIKHRSREGLILLCGYSDIKYQKSIKRDLNVNIWRGR